MCEFAESGGMNADTTEVNTVETDVAGIDTIEMEEGLCGDMQQEESIGVVDIQEDIIDTADTNDSYTVEDAADEVITDIPEDTQEVGYTLVDATEITGIDLVGDDFWNHHGNTKSDYMELASGLSEVQERLEHGENLDSISEVEGLRDTVRQYYRPNHMIKVNMTENGIELDGDGRHRIMAAQELGYAVPVIIK